MKAHRGRGNVVPAYQQPVLRRSWVISVKLRPLYLREVACNQCAGGGVGLEAGLKNTVNLTHSRILSQDRRVRTDSIYRPRHRSRPILRRDRRKLHTCVIGPPDQITLG